MLLLQASLLTTTRITRITKSITSTVFNLDCCFFRDPAKVLEIKYKMVKNNNKDNKGIKMITKSLTFTVFNLDN